MNVNIGAVTGVFGLSGEVKVKSFVEDESIFRGLKTVGYSRKDGVTGDVSVARVRKHRDVWLVKFAGVDGPEAAHDFRGSVLSISGADLPAAADDEIYWVHIKGLPVYDVEGRRIGLLDDYLETGSHDVFVITDDEGKQYMVSNNPAHVKRIDVENREVIIDINGLVENN